MTPWIKPQFGSRYVLQVCDLPEEFRKDKIEAAKKKHGKPWITETMVKPMKVKPPVLGKSKFQFQR